MYFQLEIKQNGKPQGRVFFLYQYFTLPLASLVFLFYDIQIVPKKITIGIWVSIAKEPFMASEKSNQIMNLWLSFYNSVKTPSDLAK